MPHLKSLRFGASLAALVLTAATAGAQQPAAPPPLNMKQLKPDVYAGLGGAGGNSTVIIGKTSVIVVDAKTTPAGAKDLLTEIAKITPKPVTTVILTHSDGDHVNGLAGFPAGVKVIAHENNKKEQEAALSAGGRGAPPADRLPTVVVTKNKDTMTIDGVKIELYHWGPAHTSGDLVVYLPAQKIVATGDIIATQRPDPLIHPEKNGSSEGWITTAKGIAGLNADQFVPGHGDMQTKADIQARLKATEDKRAKIVAMVKQGKSIDEIKVAVGDQTPAPGGRGPGIPFFTDVVYQELTKKPAA
jgi:glyoxylase-like metal-dependent hydrolase (beta-lactamase superfamily II)